MKIALISDIHEDIVSLKKAFRMIEIEKCDQIVCLGDILGYPFARAKYKETRNVSECISLIRQNCSHVILGNHDVFHLKKFPKYNAGYTLPPHWYELTPEQMKLHAGDKVWNYSDDYPVMLSEREKEYMQSLPEYIIKEFGEKKLLFSHFVFPNFTGYISLNNGDGRLLNEHFKYLKKNKCHLSICGHMHIEGVGVCYEQKNSFMSRFFDGFLYYSYGEKQLKSKPCSITIPALADNSQVNGFAIFDTESLKLNSISLNPNRRFIL